VLLWAKKEIYNYHIVVLIIYLIDLFSKNIAQKLSKKESFKANNVIYQDFGIQIENLASM
jgi:hypothetical protein